MIGLKSIEEYQLPLTDIACLLDERGFSTNTSFYRIEFQAWANDHVKLVLLITGNMAQICLLIPLPINVIDFRIEELTSMPMDHTLEERRAPYFESVPVANFGLRPFLRQMRRLRPYKWSNYQGLCMDGLTIKSDILIFGEAIHSFSAYCAREPYSEYARHFFHLGLLSFQEVRSLKFLAIMLTFL